jgi:hypothetical protein
MFFAFLHLRLIPQSEHMAVFVDWGQLYSKQYTAVLKGRQKGGSNTALKKSLYRPTIQRGVLIAVTELSDKMWLR